MFKKCSIVYIGFWSGFKFIDGKVDFNKPIPKKSRDELEKLTSQFKSTLNPNGNDNEFINDAAKRFLKNNGYIVAYSDYDSSDVNESMSRSDVDKFLKKAKDGTVKFKYKKVEDNSIRKAQGTLKSDVIKHGLNGLQKAKRQRNIPDSILIYWDLDKNMFRCFRKDYFIGYI